MEAFELLQSAGQDEDTFVTDFAIYKIITIVTVYLPMIISTFLLSQEYLGKLLLRQNALSLHCLLLICRACLNVSSNSSLTYPLPHCGLLDFVNLIPR